MSLFDATCRKQDDLLYTISRTKENIKRLGKERRTATGLEGRLAHLEASWAKFQENHDLLLESQNEDNVSQPYFKEDKYNLCLESYLEQKEFVQLELLPYRSNSTEISVPGSSTKPSVSTPALPRISLPRFTGQYQDWPSFRDLFVSMIHKNADLSDVQRLHYLRTNVAGEASRLVATLPMTDASFKRAWSALENRYEHRRRLIDSHLETVFRQKALPKESAVDLKNLYTRVSEALAALEALSAPLSHWDWILVYHVSRLLDTATHRAWETSLGGSREPATFIQLMEFLDNRIRTYEVIESRRPAYPDKTTVSFRSNVKQPSVRVHATTTNSLKCACCGDDHYIASCPKYKELSIPQRYNIVGEKNLCLNCLGYHHTHACRSKKTCRLCDRRHHSSIHDAVCVTGPDTPSTSTSTTAASVNHTQPLSLTTTVKNRILLATATASIITGQTGPRKIRILLDQGSEISFIREAVVQTLGITRKHASVPLIGIGASRTLSTRGIALITLRSYAVPSAELTLYAHILPKLTGLTPKSTINDCKHWRHLADLNLADPQYGTPGLIDVIVGADYFGSLIREGIRKGELGDPIAQNTIFGWVVSGPTGLNAVDNEVQSYTANLSEDASLIDLVERFWIMDQVKPSNDNSLTPDESACEQHFLSTHQRDHDGRYVVRLPFRHPPEPLGNSRLLAEQALKRIHRRFARDVTFKELYNDFLQEYQQLGHMSALPFDQPEDPMAYFLPHHGVMRASSTTTRLRVVFNGSAKTNRNISLNDCLLRGPKLQKDLDGIILRWRRYPIVFSCDIEKMYRQIKIHPSDRHHQQILWAQTTTEATRSYKLNTVTYGLTSAPYLALRVLQQLTNDEGNKFPLAVPVINHDTYVDDILSGAYTSTEAKTTVQHVKQLLRAGGFTSHKWTSNDPSVLDTTNHQSLNSAISFDSIDDSAILRTLGLSWKVKSDSFVFDATTQRAPSHWTKRQVLSTIARIFDPLGWLAPYIITAKILLQRMWTTSLQWDDPLPPLFLGSWCSFYSNLANLNKISIPRWLGTIQGSQVEVHGFSDASQDAIAACVYLLVLSNSQEPSLCTLLSAKARVAPLKKMTIPRLELSAAVLLARLIAKLTLCLELRTVPVHAWTDSTVVLHWIRGPATRWKDFVANRVNVVQELLPSATWQHVPGKENPADMASRGVSLEQLNKSSLWWHGPTWLHESQQNWPSSPLSPLPEVDLEERKQPILVAHTITDFNPWEIITRFSRLSRLLRVTAYIFRAVVAFRKRRNSNSNPGIGVEELIKAKHFWIKQTQQASYSVILQKLKTGQSLDKSCPFKTLTPFLDDKGIMRVGGRLKNSSLDPDVMHPVILPADSILTTLIIRDAHHRTLHGGVQLTLSTIRQEYWITSGRRIVKSHIYNCVICTRYRAQAAQQLMGQLPSTRVNPARPFLHSGVDYAGPFLLKTWRGRASRTYKAYLIVFVCFSTSAVHLELATDYTTDGFLAAYCRFCGRRGACASLTSDCGSNFVGADAELKRLFKSASQEAQQITTSLALVGTIWKFNPPGAPHSGGKWEAAVKSTKFHLKRVLGDTILTYEEFSTILAQIEGILNSRPLCPLSDDPTDLNSLTPSHFLIGESITSFPTPSLSDEPQCKLSRWQLVHQTIERFWHRWSTEYIQRLQAISKWRTTSPPIKIGALVLIIDERLPPMKWNLARVTAVHPGSDGLVRVATVRTGSSTYRRPITKLCILPVSSSSE